MTNLKDGDIYIYIRTCTLCGTRYTLITQQLLLLLGPIKNNSLLPNPVNKVLKLIIQMWIIEYKKKNNSKTV